MSNNREPTTIRPYDIRFKLCLVGIYQYITGTHPVCKPPARLPPCKLVAEVAGCGEATSLLRFLDCYPLVLVSISLSIDEAEKRITHLILEQSL